MLPPGSPPVEGSVEVIDVAGWMARNVVNRHLPPMGGKSATRRPPSIVMKLDIEGTDELVLARLVATGVLCNVSYVYTEAHVRPVVVSFVQNYLADAGCATEVTVIDDEYYLTWRLGQPVPPRRA